MNTITKTIGMEEEAGNFWKDKHIREAWKNLGVYPIDESGSFSKLIDSYNLHNKSHKPRSKKFLDGEDI